MISAAFKSTKQALTPVASPYTFRLPKNGQTDPLFGCSRTFWNQKILPCDANGRKPPIKSVVVKQPGTKRGVRLILVDSARRYIEGLAREQTSTQCAA